MTVQEKIAKILRVEKNTISELEEKASNRTGKKGVLEEIVKENDELMRNRLKVRHLGSAIAAEDIYQLLIEKIKDDDLQLIHALSDPSFTEKEDVDRMLEKIKKLLPQGKGFFLKQEKAKELIQQTPPKRVMEYLGYKKVSELLEREEILEVFAAIRMFEDARWINEVFGKQYAALQPDDFELRPIEMRALNQKWVGVAQSFLKKRYQSISHLKELGFIFVVPLELGILGEITRLLSLATHYFYEMLFYSDLFKEYGNAKEAFGENVLSAIRVDIIEKRLPETKKLRFLIVPRYLTRRDENDWRLFEPHISPEAIHWAKAESAMANINSVLSGVYLEFGFWQNLGWVGDYFKTRAGGEVLVSFNIVDAIMTLIRQKEAEKYLYHHQESLWNKIFMEYFGEKELERVIREHLRQGYVEL